MNIIGIDPGKDGFLAVLTGDTEQYWFHPMPTVNVAKKGTKREYDCQRIERILRAHLPAIAILEKQQAMPATLHGRKQGVASSFSTGVGYGLWLGILAGMRIRHIVVHPRTWQKFAHRDIPGDNTKARSIIAAQRLFPTVDLRKTDRCRKPHDGKADALLLAWYGKTVVLAEKETA